MSSLISSWSEMGPAERARNLGFATWNAVETEKARVFVACIRGNLPISVLICTWRAIADLHRNRKPVRQNLSRAA